jgi:hypothetical protein
MSNFRTSVFWADPRLGEPDGRGLAGHPGRHVRLLHEVGQEGRLF